MATRTLLAELSDLVERLHGVSVRFEAAGGVDVARRIRAGVDADLVVLAAGAISQLAADGVVRADTVTPLFVSDVVAATRDVAAPVPLSTEAELRAALLGADRIAYSTGPSGTALLDLLRRWELVEAVGRTLVQAPPGTPVGSLLAGGDADLGFQQRSELVGVAGVRVLGPLPGSAAIRSTFTGAVLACARNDVPARAVLGVLRSDDAAHAVAAAGMSIA